MPVLTGFDDIRFPITISLAAAGGEEMQTQVHVTGAGYEYRNAEWEEVRGRWDIANRVRTLDDAALLARFFRARAGMTRSFRWQPLDLVDRTAVNSFFGQGNGIKTVFPLFKLYDDDINPTLRRIVLPIDGIIYTTATPFAIYKDAVFQSSGYTVDWRNGRITFGSPPADGAVLSWYGEFDVPARFGMPHLRRQFLTHEKVSFEEVSIIEVLPYEILETPDP